MGLWCASLLRTLGSAEWLNAMVDLGFHTTGSLVANVVPMAEGAVQVVQAQVNLGLNPASILGIALAVAGAGLYFLRNFRPELARDHDIFFSAVGLLCGLILLSQGWRLDPILQFGVFLLSGSTVFFAWESVRLRGVATEQAKRSPIVDEERPVSRVYRAEFDEYDTFNERPQRRRIKGTRDVRGRDEDDSYEEETSRRPPLRGDARQKDDDQRFRAQDEVDDRPRKRRTKPKRDVPEDIDTQDGFEDRPVRSSRSRDRTPPPPLDDDVVTPSKPRRQRPPSSEQQPPRRKSSTRAAADEDYVDYQPIDRSADRASDRDDRDDRDDRASKRTDDDDDSASRKDRGSSADRGSERPISFVDDEDDNSASFN